jgi:hypothetical protein
MAKTDNPVLAEVDAITSGKKKAGRPLKDGEEQVSYDEYKRRALAMGAAEDALMGDEDYANMQMRLGGALAKYRKRGQMEIAGDRIKGAMDTAKSWITPDYAKVSAYQPNKIG